MKTDESSLAPNPDTSLEADPGEILLTVALIGNPNTGKTSLFNSLTGFRRHVANYPGVTVETASGPIKNVEPAMLLVDLPGTYSLAAISPDEMVVNDALHGRIAGLSRPDVILAIVDASNLHRNLYLVSQLLDLKLPLVIAVNMIDVAAKRGIELDCELLSARLGLPVIPVIATRENTIAPLRNALHQATLKHGAAEAVELPNEIAGEMTSFREHNPGLSPPEALRIIMERGGYAEKQFIACGGDLEQINESRRRMKEAGIDGPRLEVQTRYAWIHKILDGAVTRPKKPLVTWTDRIDRVLTHRVWGAICLLGVLYVMFEALFRFAGVVMDQIDCAFAALGELVAGWLPAGAVQSLAADGLIGGVGGVLVFLPQILLLFAFIAMLEDCGYMARAAYMNDRIMRVLGLSGRSFIPLLSGFACSVPAILGTRAIADRRERFVTIMIIPFISCSARLPVYVLLISAVVPSVKYLGGWLSLQALIMLGMYLVGVVAAIPAAFMLHKAAPAGPKPNFILELPSYKMPRLRAIWRRMYFAGREFIVRAGTIILAVNLCVWALGYFPHSETTRAAVVTRAAEQGWERERHESELAGAYIRDSYLGAVGRAIEPVVEPIGWDWRIGMAVAASFPAREVVVASLGTIYNLGAETDESSHSLTNAIRNARHDETGEKIFTIPVALSVMIFFALCAQCSGALVVIARETGSWKWAAVSFTGMTTLAYFAAWGAATLARACGL